MIYTELVEIDGREFVRTYSDTYTIQRDGVEYEDAVDPVDSGRTYTETENLLPLPDPAEVPTEEEITAEEFLAMVEEVL